VQLSKDPLNKWQNLSISWLQKMYSLTYDRKLAQKMHLMFLW